MRNLVEERTLSVHELLQAHIQTNRWRFRGRSWLALGLAPDGVDVRVKTPMGAGKLHYRRCWNDPFDHRRDSKGEIVLDSGESLYCEIRKDPCKGSKNGAEAPHYFDSNGYTFGVWECCVYVTPPQPPEAL